MGENKTRYWLDKMHQQHQQYGSINDRKQKKQKSEINIHNLQNIIKYLGNSCKYTVKSICAFLLKYEMSLL